MALSSEEEALLAKRARRLKSWPYVGGGLLGLLGACGLWLWVKVPYLINPWALGDAIRGGSLSESTVLLLASMLPVVLLMLLLFAVAVVGLIFAAFANERKLIEMIRRLNTH
ncbi:MAG: hypothetical protein JXK05_02940 [Campylobacterales bacterium]|nr:hypothetical protein [Campylobacterales bacterium]